MRGREQETVTKSKKERVRVRGEREIMEEMIYFIYPFSSYIQHENLIKLSAAFLLYFLYFCIVSEEFFAQ